MEEKKKSNAGLIILVVILLLACVGMGAFIFINKDKLTSNETTSKIEEGNKEDSEEKELKTFDIAQFDGTKVINGNGEVNYASSAKEATNSEKKASLNGPDVEFLKAELQSDAKSVVATVNWAEMYYDRESKNYTYTISNFDSKIRKVYASGWGQAMGSDTIFYLMENGTVEYTPITSKIVKASVDSADSVQLKSYGKIQNVEDVVMIATVSASPANSQVGGHVALIGIKADGTFYDISKILNEANEYKN